MIADCRRTRSVTNLLDWARSHPNRSAVGEYQRVGATLQSHRVVQLHLFSSLHRFVLCFAALAPTQSKRLRLRDNGEDDEDEDRNEENDCTLSLSSIGCDPGGVVKLMVAPSILSDFSHGNEPKSVRSAKFN